MIVVTAPTGNIGHHVIQHLLDTGEEVRVIVRDPEKLGHAAVVDRAFRCRFGVLARTAQPAAHARGGLSGLHPPRGRGVSPTRSGARRRHYRSRAGHAVGY